MEDRIDLLDSRYIEDLETIIEILYKKYVCSVFGHEYYRRYGEIEYDVEGVITAKYTDRVYEDEKELISFGSPGTKITYCKYCEEKIYG